MSKEEDSKNEERLRKIEEAIGHYLRGHRDLVRLGIVLLDQGRDLTALKETIDSLGEREAKELLLVSVGEMVHFYREKREGAELN